MSKQYHFDIVLFGAGIAGLWLLNRLQNAGYNCCLLDNHSLGGKQSMASQGMIHGGIKYALSGALNNSSEIIASMPDHWKACLEGKADIDLQGLPVLSEDFYLWSSGGLGSKLSSFFASKLTRGRVEKVSRENNPPPLNHPDFKGQAYKLVDVVMDVPQLAEHLARPFKDRIFKIDWQQSHYDKQNNCLKIGESLLNSQLWICTAGEGNGELINTFGASDIEMQLRPLQQVFVKSPELPPFYGHCIGASTSPSPRLTVSSHRCEDGQWAWYLGGDLATDGVKRTEQQQLDFSKKELTALFPWINWEAAAWSTLSIDRAEPKQKSLVKPDDAYVAQSQQNPQAIFAWPTKLTLAPQLGNKTLALLETLGVKPGSAGELPELPALELRETEWHKAFS